MAYTKNTWVDQDVERPKTYEVTNNQDGSITLTDSFGLVTELGTPVNATNMNHIEDGILDCYNDLVNKSGDTMTGDLLLDEGAGYKCNVSLPSSTPSTNTYISAYEILNDNVGVGGFYAGYLTNGSTISRIQHKRVVNNTTVYSQLNVGVDASGNAFCNFPNTTCVDGEWTQRDVNIISSSVSLTGSSDLTYTLSLPNDGQNYMVLLSARGDTGTTSGDSATILLSSDICLFTYLAANRTRTASSVSFSGNIYLPVGTSHKIYVARSSNNKGTLIDLAMRGYRRIGTNS
jgi:hypothetical protein